MTTEAGVKRAHQLSEEIADLVCDIKDRGAEMQSELGMNPLEILTMVTKNLGPPVMSFFASFAPAIGREPPDPMVVHIDKLFAERGVKAAEGDAPSVPDVIVWLRGVLQPLPGVLSKTSDGLLRLGSVGQMGQDAFLVDQVFAYDDVLSIATKNAITAAPKSGLITGH